MPSPDPTAPINSSHVPAPVGPKLWATTLIGAALAASVAWGLGESGLLDASPTEVDYTLLGQKVHGATSSTMEAAKRASGVRVFAALGALLGLAAGASATLARGKAARGLPAIAAGLVLGGAAGGLAAMVVVPLHGRMVLDGGSEFLTAFVAHAGIWAPIGAAAGLALGMGLGLGWRKGLAAAVGGLIGGVVASVAFDVLGSILFPLGKTGEPISATAPSRFLARVLLALFVVSIALASATNDPGRRRGPVSPAPKSEDS